MKYKIDIKWIWNWNKHKSETPLASDTPTIKCGISGAPSCRYRWVLKWFWISANTDILPKQKHNQLPNSHDSSFLLDLRSFFFQGRSVHIHPLPFLFTGSKFWGQSEPPIPTWVWPLERMVCGCQGFVVDGGCYNPPWSGQWNVPPMSKVFNIGSSSRMKTREIVLVYKIPDFWIKNDLFHVSTFVKSPFSADCFRAPCQECFSESSLAAQTKPPVFSGQCLGSFPTDPGHSSRSSMQLKQIQTINNLDWKNNDL